MAAPKTATERQHRITEIRPTEAAPNGMSAGARARRHGGGVVACSQNETSIGEGCAALGGEPTTDRPTIWSVRSAAAGRSLSTPCAQPRWDAAPDRAGGVGGGWRGGGARQVGSLGLTTGGAIPGRDKRGRAGAGRSASGRSNIFHTRSAIARRRGERPWNGRFGAGP